MAHTVCGKIADASVQYLSASKCEMTSHHFSDLLKAFKIAGRKVLLLLDNCSSHRGFDRGIRWAENELACSNLPQNTTAKLQPCDQGVIRFLKAQYRRRLGKLLLHQEANQVSLWEGLMMLRASWAIDVKQDVILNAWSKSGLAGKNEQVEENEIDETHPDIEKMADIKEEVATVGCTLSRC